MTSSEIRQSFLDFFREKKHTIVPSSSLLPDAPNLLFTNAGMNQFVPIFLGQEKPAWNPPRVADTQKCIRAGGKHNDLEDVGLDTYHHTFFEMLGNWSFGDYFKGEAIEWAWELVVDRWKFPAQRLYATVYKPGPGEPSEFDQEAHDHWARLFREADLDPAIHVLNGGKADNFWMMGDTGPCGPCSELHVDLTPDGDTRGKLVNAEDARCIEIWNLVFIQFNANPDGMFTPLPQHHVDTGMGFERVTAIIQDTKHLTDFSGTISNYETDIFHPIFDELEKLSGKKYGSTIPVVGQAHRLPDIEGGSRSRPTNDPDQENIDIAFRVIGDHIRALNFAIADGIIPSNEGRGYVLRRILRRAVRYGRTLGFHEPFFFRLVDVVARTMGDVFPELRANQSKIKETIRREEEAFNKTLDRGIELFDLYVQGFDIAAGRCSMLEDEFLASDSGEGDFSERYKAYTASRRLSQPSGWGLIDGYTRFEWAPNIMLQLMDRLSEASSLQEAKALVKQIKTVDRVIAGDFAFKLYDTYGFPLDLTQLMARERGLTVDVMGFDELMQKQRARARGARRRQTVEISRYEPKEGTEFVGYRRLTSKAKVLDIVDIDEKPGVVLDRTPFYAQGGGQVGDSGTLKQNGREWSIVDTQKKSGGWIHLVEIRSGHPHTNVFTDADATLPAPGSKILASVDTNRRRATQRHHTATHLLHWALHKVVSRDAVQKGSYVGPDKLTFDFASAPLSKEQVRDLEKLVNQRVLENSKVSWTNVPYAEVRKNPDILQFFVEKYAEIVRVVQIGGKQRALNGYSMELCGGTHVDRTGEIGLFRIVHESAISTGIRRIEAVAGLEAYEDVQAITDSYARLATILKAQTIDIEKRIANLLQEKKELEKAQASSVQREGAIYVKEHCKPALIRAVPAWIDVLPLRERGVLLLQNVLEALKAQQFSGVAILGGVDSTNTVQLGAYVSPELTRRFHAGRIIEAIAPIIGGKGGGRPDTARGAGKLVDKIDKALAKARELLS